MSKQKCFRFSALTFVCFATLVLFAVPARSQTGGDALFQKKCSICHGADGKGATAVGKADKVRDLSSAEVQAQSDADLTTIISSGKGKMPAYGKSLKPDEVKALVTYVRGLAKK
ncbi:MAG: cytochrome c [Candidatus Acidiferrum sp.]|jgi:mono/diheme cytochrome c family protein